MISFKEYNRLIDNLMKEIFEAERQRRIIINNLREELLELGKTGTISDTKRFKEILEELDILYPAEDELIERMIKKENEYSPF